jgi:hypothetical protein
MYIMKSRDVVIGFIFLVILIAGVLWALRVKNNKTSNLPLPTPNISQKIKNAFPNLNIPDGVERANLSDVTGGNSVGVATGTEVVANLPELTNGKFYQVLLENSSGKSVVLGKMRISKSGYILEYNSASFPGYNKVVIIQGSTHILEGSF